MVWLPVLGICNTCVRMLTHAIAHRGCTNTVRESTLKVDCGKKSLAAQGSQTLSSVPDLTFNQLSYIPALHFWIHCPVFSFHYLFSCMTVHALFVPPSVLFFFFPVFFFFPEMTLCSYEDIKIQLPMILQ